MQILVSFSQLSGRYSSVFKQSKQSGTKNKNVRTKEATGIVADVTICRESFDECLRNFDRSGLADMRSVNVRSLAMLAGASHSPFTLEGLTSCRKISYVSSESFEKNKNGWVKAPTATADMRVASRLVIIII